MAISGDDYIPGRTDGQLSAHLPPALIAALDRWRIEAGPINRAEAMRRLLAKALDIEIQQQEPPIAPAPSRQDQDQRAEQLVELYRTLGTFEAVGRAVGLSKGRVACLIHRLENRNAAKARELARQRDW